MFLNLTWLIPGLPIIASVLITVLLLSFDKTMNRLTKPVSYLLILSLVFSGILDFVLLKRNIVGNYLLFGSDFVFTVDRSALLVSDLIGLLFLFIMIFSFIKLKRRTGYVRYFVLLGFLSGFLLVFPFSGSLFHNLYDPLILSLDKIQMLS